MNLFAEDSRTTSDIVFTNARMVDGTGAPSFRGRVGVKNGKVEKVSRDEALDADEVVGVGGTALTPGFTEAHSHPDSEVLEGPFLTPKLHQGITAEILGQDDLDPVPVSPGRVDGRSIRIQTLSGSVGSAGVFESMNACLDAVDDTRPTLSLGILTGHGTTWFEAMGMVEQTATTEESGQMKEFLQESLDDDCPGLSTGLIHHPQVHLDIEKLLVLCGALLPTNRPFVAHIRNEGHWLFEAIYEFIFVGYETNVPFHLSHFELSGRKQHGKASLALSFLEIVREMGIDITAGQCPYVAGSTSLSAVFPPQAHGDGVEETPRLLREPASRERMAAGIRDFYIPFWENDARTVGWENILICDVGSSRSDIRGATISKAAKKRGATLPNTYLDLLVREELNIRIITLLGREGDVEIIFQSPLVCVGSDGFISENPHSRLYGTYPKIIDEFVHEKNLISLGEAVRKMTSLPARIYGLQSKGIIHEGPDADLVSFRPEWASTESNYNNVKQLPTGIGRVIVSGEFILRDG